MRNAPCTERRCSLHFLSSATLSCCSPNASRAVRASLSSLLSSRATICSVCDESSAMSSYALFRPLTFLGGDAGVAGRTCVAVAVSYTHLRAHETPEHL